MNMRERLARRICADPDAPIFYSTNDTPLTEGPEMWRIVLPLVDAMLDELMNADDAIIAHGMIVPKMINAGTWWIKGLKVCFQDIVSAIKAGK